MLSGRASARVGSHESAGRVSVMGETLGRIVIVGAGLAGMRTAQALRHQGYDGRLTLVGVEPHLPYDRPPLSKEYLAGEVDAEEIAVCDPDDIASLCLELLLEQRAVGLNLSSRCVDLADGRRLPFDKLVVATGADPVIPESFRNRPGVTGFRTIEDALALRECLGTGSRVAIVGAGFIGAEVASTVRQMGYEVSLLEALDYPMQRVLGADVGAVLSAALSKHGVDLHTGTAASRLLGSQSVKGIELADGRRMESDHVVVALGVSPNIGWLTGSGLDLSDGIRCNAFGHALGSGGVIHAIGDVASWHYDSYGEHLRVEHWSTAVEMAPIVARSVLGNQAASPTLGLPYFWSDQCGTKIQLLGRIRADDRVEVINGEMASAEFIAVYHSKGRASAVLAMGLARQFTTLRPAVEQGWTMRQIGQVVADNAILT